MRIDRDEARRIARLAKLSFSDGELDVMASEMSVILDYVDQLAAIDAGEPDGPARPVATPLRDDVARSSGFEPAAARSAPEWENGFFVVPQVIGD